MVQTLLRQVKFAAHITPHPPQLFRSKAVLTQALLQSVSPIAHTHAPFEHPTDPIGPWQTVPHEPQLRRSFCKSRQMVPQRFWPTWHWQLPATQNWVPPQERPHAPQFWRSLCRSRQTPLHCPKPPVQ